MGVKPLNKGYLSMEIGPRYDNTVCSKWAQFSPTQRCSQRPVISCLPQPGEQGLALMDMTNSLTLASILNISLAMTNFSQCREFPISTDPSLLRLHRFVIFLSLELNLLNDSNQVSSKFPWRHQYSHASNLCELGNLAVCNPGCNIEIVFESLRKCARADTRRQLI